MENNIDRTTIKRAISNSLVKVDAIDVIEVIQVGQVTGFTTICQIIHDDDVITASFVKSLNQIRTNKTGPTCYDNHNLPSLAKLAILFTTLVVEYPSLKDRICTESTKSRPMTWSG